MSGPKDDHSSAGGAAGPAAGACGSADGSSGAAAGAAGDVSEVRTDDARPLVDDACLSPEHEETHSTAGHAADAESESRPDPVECDPLAASREACKAYMLLTREPQHDPAVHAAAALNAASSAAPDTQAGAAADADSRTHAAAAPDLQAGTTSDTDVAPRTHTAPDAAPDTQAGAVGADGDGKARFDHTAAQDDAGDEDNSDDRPMSLRDHLHELRKRLAYAFLLALAGFFVCWPFTESLIFPFLFKPLVQAMPEGGKLIFTSPPEAFFTYLKIAFVSGMFLASPCIFYQLWAFVAPGLYREEKRYIVPVAFFSAFFFICGGAFCYYVVFDFIFTFFMSYNQGFVQAMPKLNESLSFVLQLLLAFGLVFELPLAMFFFARLGLITADQLRRFRRYAVLLSVIVGALLTPPDVMSQLLMAGPLLLLYEISILIAAAFGRKKKSAPEDDGAAENADRDGGEENNGKKHEEERPGMQSA